MPLNRSRVQQPEVVVISFGKVGQSGQGSEGIKEREIQEKPPILARQVSSERNESDGEEDFNGVPDEWMEPVKHQMSGE